MFKVGQKLVLLDKTDDEIYEFVNYVYDYTGNPDDEWIYYKIRILNRCDDSEKYKKFDRLYTEQELSKYFLTLTELRKLKLKKILHESR